MRVASVAVAFNEARLIGPHLERIPAWVEKKVVLRSITPWQGEPEELDKTSEIAVHEGAEVIQYDWKTEEDQRNAGQEYLADYDWIIVLDPDEFLDNEGWEDLHATLQQKKYPAYVVGHQRVFWKDKEVSPHTDYQQIIAVKPSVRFTESRVVDSPYGVAPVELYHFSWVKTDHEVLSKIQHYSHANELIPNWYEDVWLAGKETDLHPKTPETLKALIPVELPKELEKVWHSLKKI